MSKMDFFRFLTAVVVLALWTTGMAAADRADSIARDEYRRDDRIFSDKEYYYWDKGGKLEFSLPLPADSAQLFGSLIRLETSDGERFNLVLAAAPGRLPELLWLHGSEAVRISGYRVHSGDTVPVSFAFHGPRVRLEVADTAFSLPAPGLRSDQGYRIRLADGTDGIGVLKARGWRHISDKETRVPISPWFWIMIVILVDALVFVIVQLRKRRQRKLHLRSLETQTPLVADKFTVQFPTRNAVYLFGELRVFDCNGEEVSSRFSPLLRELFLLLVVKAPEGGISSKELTETLWIDKDDASAKNNRSVNLHKLRALLANVADCRIGRTAGKWLIQFDDSVYIDYFECLTDKIQPDRLTADHIRILSLMTLKGGLLPSCDYLWLDRYKSRITENMVGALLKYASLLGDHEASETKLQVCDIVLSFDATNESALRLKCLTYISMNKQFMAKSAYEHFCRIYRELYGEAFPKTYSDIISH